MEKPKKDPKDRTPLFYEGNIPIYESNPVLVTFHHVVYHKLVKLMLAHRLSMAALIRMMTSPCQRCGHDKIEVPLIQMPSRVGKGPCLSDFHKNTDDPHGQTPDHDTIA